MTRQLNNAVMEDNVSSIDSKARMDEELKSKRQAHKICLFKKWMKTGISR